MKLYIQRKNKNINAVADYNIETRECVVLAGSILSDFVSESEKFRSSKSIISARRGKLKGCKLMEDVPFKSVSSAANFVTGTSTNGYVAWKDKNGVALKEILKEDKDE